MNEQHNLPAKSESHDIDKITSTILEFNDANIVADIFQQLGWSLSQEIIETLSVVRQDVNLGAKMTAIKHLRKLLEESAEQAGLIAKVSKTVPSDDGSSITFSAKRIAAVLSRPKPVKSTTIENKESDNDTRETKRRQTEITGGSRSSEDTPERQSATGNSARTDGGRDSGTGNKRGGSGDDVTGQCTFGEPSPCIKHRPPGRDIDLYPGIASADNAETED
jgi:hypothetical protein